MIKVFNKGRKKFNRMSKTIAITVTIAIISIILSSILFSQSLEREKIYLREKIDSSRVDLLYGDSIWTTYFKAQKTRSGAIVRLKIVDDSTYYIQWGNSTKMKTFPEKFNLEGAEAWIPRLIYENNDYLVMRGGCGNPCWVGYFLPLHEGSKPQMIHEYLGYDLENHLVAYVSDNSIEILNLKTNSIEVHKTKGCVSAFIGYCIDSLSIKNRTLKYKWIPDSRIKSNKGMVVIEKVNL